ncbi:MAG: AtpZ/AtpI family protein [Magnetococcales bacterium]|nr:AtpZ/AtpI family protein [Magnetococcales bacterium]
MSELKKEPEVRAPEVPQNHFPEGSGTDLADKTEKKGDDSGRNAGLGMAMRLGTELVVATMIGTGMGYWLDSQLGTEPWLLIFFLILGSVAGFKNVYRIVNPG